MVDVDRSAIELLNSRNIKLFIGVPHEKATLTGTINGSNKDFVIDEDYAGIYCKRGTSIIPTKDDVVAYTKKGSTYTEAEVTAVGTVEHSTLDIEQYAKITLKTPPASADVDSVHLDYVEELRPWFAQSIKVGVKQDATTKGELGENVKRTSYGAQEITIDEDMILGDDLTWMTRLLHETYAGTYDVETGYDVYTMIAEPADIYVKMPLERGSTFVGAWYFEGKLVPTGLVDTKEGDDIGFSLQFAIDESPKLILPEPA